ncbi:PLC-like phosphodiesterase [Hypoxylon argillaceum]|nr:PLC-like phosphodiesterase [Hypoxylon argillaceum]KAI1152813.1 PLC-like phosphodiesterase [Nemania diffusa]
MRFSIGVSALLLARLGPAIANGESRNTLAQLALEKILRDGRDIFGDLDESSTAPNDFTSFSSSPSPLLSYETAQGDHRSRHANWMAGLPDAMPLAHLTIPGTHDAATWNYTQETQDGLSSATRCDGTTALPARVYRCQRLSIADALEGGIRFFDLRFAADPLDASARLAFWHGPALLSATASVEDVLFGLFAWLDAHPGEAVLASLQYERGTRANATSDARVQRLLFDALTSEAAARHVHQGKGVLPTLGEVRGKVVLFRRFDLDMLPPAFEARIPGLHMAPAKWLDNGAAFELVFNETGGAAGKAFIEDFYHPGDYGPVADNIEAKFAAVEGHLQSAAAGDFESLFVTFTSGTHVEVDPPVYPVVMALGSAAAGTGDVGGTPALPGVNHRLLGLLASMKGKRLGIVVMDFFEEPGGLVDLLLDS